MSVKVSVIVTIYGVEKYIKRCVTSLFEQTMTSDIEFIFVDDCSKDQSIVKLNALIEAYPLRKSQTKLLSHDVNKGLPQARLTGLNQARGEYIWFVDSDDWVEHNACELFYNIATQQDFDIVISDYNICNNNNITIKNVKLREERMLSDILLEINNCSVWNKFIRRKLFSKFNVIFPTANMGEDLAIISQLFVNNIKVGKINNTLYNYFVNPNSISLIQDKNSYIRRYNDLKDNTQILIQTLQKYGKIDKFKNELLYRKYAVIAQLMPIISTPEIYSIWKKSYLEINPKTILLSKIPIVTKFFYILVYLKLYSSFKKLSMKFISKI